MRRIATDKPRSMIPGALTFAAQENFVDSIKNCVTLRPFLPLVLNNKELSPKIEAKGLVSLL